LTLAFAPVERRSADALFARWARRRGANSAAESWLHQLLLGAAFDEAPQTVCRRRLAISSSGVPVVYSHKFTRRERPAFRMLAEPGGTSITVAEQVLLSRALLDQVFDHCAWSEARAPVNAMLDVLLPADFEDFSTWHGGLGFGLDCGDGGPELRIYCNVRHGDLRIRWQRLVDAIGEIADQRAEPALREIVDLSSPRAVPAGLALAFDDRGVTGVRVYCGLSDATAGGAVAALPRAFASSASSIHGFVTQYCAAFGDLVSQDITLAFDFAVRDGLMHPRVARYKVDIYCEAVSRRERAGLIAWTENQLLARGLPRSDLQLFLVDLDDTFSGSTLQYLSLGCRKEEEEITVYCIPGDRSP
jgi:hypothetical protein